MLFTMLLVVPIILAAVLFFYTTAGILIHLRHLYMDGRAQRRPHLAG
jgi:hypothetical protein